MASSPKMTLLRHGNDPFFGKMSEMSGFEENQEQNAKNMTFKSDGSGTRNDGFEGPLKV